MDRLYSYLRTLLFKLPPETAHHVALHALALRTLLAGKHPSSEQESTQVFGVKFPNPVGLAAGLDKDAQHLRGLEALGFGFIEIGTVTPKPQSGNPKPRLFRLTDDRALINRMGFNSAGAEQVARNLEKYRPSIPLGINIGKNRDTKLSDAARDYQWCLTQLHDYADYIVVNISSPNTEGLRKLQQRDQFQALLEAVLDERQRLQRGNRAPVAILAKLSPDLDLAALDQLSEVVRDLPLQGLIATNTSITREGLRETLAEAGGLSGQPLAARARASLVALRQRLPPDFPIISVGGIDDANSARDRFTAGAQLIQVYTGLIYSGPGLVRQLRQALHPTSSDSFIH